VNNTCNLLVIHKIQHYLIAKQLGLFGIKSVITRHKVPHHQIFLPYRPAVRAERSLNQPHQTLSTYLHGYNNRKTDKTRSCTAGITQQRITRRRIHRRQAPCAPSLFYFLFCIFSSLLIKGTTGMCRHSPNGHCTNGLFRAKMEIPRHIQVNAGYTHLLSVKTLENECHWLDSVVFASIWAIFSRWGPSWSESSISIPAC
jgi:hypothetical protein